MFRREKNNTLDKLPPKKGSLSRRRETENDREGKKNGKKSRKRDGQGLAVDEDYRHRIWDGFSVPTPSGRYGKRFEALQHQCDWKEKGPQTRESE